MCLFPVVRSLEVCPGRLDVLLAVRAHLPHEEMFGGSVVAALWTARQCRACDWSPIAILFRVLDRWIAVTAASEFISSGTPAILHNFDAGGVCS